MFRKRTSRRSPSFWKASTAGFIVDKLDRSAMKGFRAPLEEGHSFFIKTAVLVKDVVEGAPM